MAVNTQPSIFAEWAAFIVSQPTLEGSAGYRASGAVQQRVSDLLETNRESGLTPNEHEEIQRYLAVAHRMTLAKAKARRKRVSTGV